MRPIPSLRRFPISIVLAIACFFGSSLSAQGRHCATPIVVCSDNTPTEVKIGPFGNDAPHGLSASLSGTYRSRVPLDTKRAIGGR